MQCDERSTGGDFVLVHQNNVIAMIENPGVCSLDLTTPMLKCNFCDVGIRLQSHYALIDARTKRFHKVLYETSTRIIDICYHMAVNMVIMFMVLLLMLIVIIWFRCLL